MSCHASTLIPATGTPDDLDDRQHHRHFDEHTDNGRKRRAGLKAEERNGGRNRQFEEIASPDQRRRTGDAPLDAKAYG